MKSPRAFVIAALMLPFVAACSVDSTGSGSGNVETTDFASSLGVNLAASTKTADGLYYRDISVGTGALVVAGNTVNARYDGYISSGTLFQSNQTTGVTFVLGTGQVIAGWDEGIVGMKVGGKRQLIIPSSLAYGPYGNGTTIPGNAVIVFNVEVVSAQ
jgi:FKBP-type peptidyl-prolyl cis-trans isomerase FkpA